VVEVGVGSFLAEHKPDGCDYLGIDIRDETSRADAKRDIHILQTDSADLAPFRRWMQMRGHTQIDFLFVDGHHSVNACVADWHYMRWLAPDGIAVWHDTNFHPGPVAVMQAVNRDIWDVDPVCTETTDWGMCLVSAK
jgi:hypothetical protein